ncbi:zinc ribbon domain-containing protein [Halorubellus sp. PRR65]|uniref:zinc ribbon domain-containing protein n=1 Tax=Halorubellus sp. PRR65 TaxID=3098148 RepID=UPI002B25FD1D|nr:zinc ribbon domain-containing protein [Halorubellus sp. PRR65]
MVERSSTRRPWLAAVLGVIATGAGHLYLRRWLRAVGWLALATVVTTVYVPESALMATAGGDTVPLEQFLPTLTVIALSVADAYLLARLDNRQQSSPGASESGRVNAASQGSATTADAQPTPSVDDDEAVECPHCGKPLDPELEFCHWCTTDLGDFDAHRPERRQDDG